MCLHYGVTSPVPVSQVVPWVETGDWSTCGTGQRDASTGSRIRAHQHQHPHNTAELSDKYFARTAMDVRF